MPWFLCHVKFNINRLSISLACCAHSFHHMSKTLWSRSCHVGSRHELWKEAELNGLISSRLETLRTWQKKPQQHTKLFSIVLYLKEFLLHCCKPGNKQKCWPYYTIEIPKGWRLTQWKEMYKHWTHREAHKWWSADLTITWPWLYYLPHQSISPLLHYMAYIEQSTVI